MKDDPRENMGRERMPCNIEWPTNTNPMTCGAALTNPPGAQSISAKTLFIHIARHSERIGEEMTSQINFGANEPL